VYLLDKCTIPVAFPQGFSSSPQEQRNIDTVKRFTYNGDDFVQSGMEKQVFPQPNQPQEVLTWDDIDKLITHLLPQFNGEFDGLVMITNGGLIPGGILCEAMDIQNVHTAAVHIERSTYENMLWPTFMQFPNDSLVSGKRLLVIDDIWAKGRNIVIVKSRLEFAGATVETAVLHYRPKSSQFPDTGPDYYGAITSNYIIYPWASFSSDYFTTAHFQPPQQD